MKQKDIVETHERRVRYELDNELIVVVPPESPRYGRKRGGPSKRYRILGASVLHKRYDEPKVSLRSQKIKLDGEPTNTRWGIYNWDIQAMSTEDQAALDVVLTMAKYQYRKDYPVAP